MVAMTVLFAAFLAMSQPTAAFRLQDNATNPSHPNNWLTDLVKTVQHNVERKTAIEHAIEESKKAAARNVYWPERKTAPAAAKKVEEPKKVAPAAAKAVPTVAKKVEEPKKVVQVATKPVPAVAKKVEEPKKVELPKVVPAAAQKVEPKKAAPVVAAQKVEEPKKAVPVAAAKMAEEKKPVVEAKKVEEPKATPKPVEAQKPVEVVKAVEVPKPAEPIVSKAAESKVEQKIEETKVEESEDDEEAVATKLAEQETETAERLHHRTVSKYDKYLTDKHVAAKVAKAKEAVQAQRKTEAKVERARQEAQKEAVKKRLAEKAAAAATVPAFVTPAPPSRPGTIRLSVINGKGQGVQLTVAKTATVKVLAQAAVKRFGLEGKGATFWRRGKQLQEDERLEAYGLQDLDAVDVYSK